MIPRDPNWNMDTGASSHLMDNTSILTSISNQSINPSVFVGNGHSIPITICKSTRDNDVSVECDAYGFSVKDYQTDRLLLHCHSTGDLYSVNSQPPIHPMFALISLSSTTWHRRLDHPGDDVLR
ncbi:hypothetical protein Tco_0999367, partial [Tanacetum coccineum]